MIQVVGAISRPTKLLFINMLIDRAAEPAYSLTEALNWGGRAARKAAWS